MTPEPESNTIHPDRESINRIHPQAQPNQEGGQPPIDRPPGSDIQPAPEHEWNTEHCRPDKTPIGKYVLEVLAAGILAAYTVAAFQQLDAMSGQLEQMKQSGTQTDKLICLYQQQVAKLNEQLGILKNNVTETHALAEQAKRTAGIMQAQQRAWMGADGPPIVQISAIDSNNIKGVIALPSKNFGNAPALKVWEAMEIVGFSSGKELDRQVQLQCTMALPFVTRKKPPTMGVSDPHMFERQWGTIVFPNQPYSRPAEYSNQAVNVLGKEAYVIGCIAYQDQFSHPHWTKVCYKTGDFIGQEVRDASSFTHLVPCNTNNYTDDVGR